MPDPDHTFAAGSAAFVIRGLETKAGVILDAKATVNLAVAYQDAALELDEWRAGLRRHE